MEDISMSVRVWTDDRELAAAVGYGIVDQINASEYKGWCGQPTPAGFRRRGR